MSVPASLGAFVNSWESAMGNGDGRDNLASPEEHEEKLIAELSNKFRQSTYTAAAFETMNLVPRKPLMGKWMKEGDLGFVFGERGCGKTWLVDAIATHISVGKDLFGWEVLEPVPVLYIDGEMPGDDARDRIKGMSPGNKLLHVLHHEVLFDLFGMAMNLTDSKPQQALTKLCIDLKVKVVILDNLSCLFRGMKENDADEWEKVLGWLLDLRRRHIAVLIVHHSGKFGSTMRGTSRREDAAFWVIKVEPIYDPTNPEKGAKFSTIFTKQRNSDTREWVREWSFRTDPGGVVLIGCNQITMESKILDLITDGIESASEIAQELAVSKPSVSRCAKKLENEGKIEIKGRLYKAV